MPVLQVSFVVLVSVMQVYTVQGWYSAISDPGWFGLERAFCEGKYTFCVIVNFGKFFVYVYILQNYVLHMGLYNVQDVNISNQ